VSTHNGLIEGMTIPLISEFYKPKERLKEGDIVISNNCETSEK
jgi:SRSO17 transposase